MVQKISNAILGSSKADVAVNGAKVQVQFKFSVGDLNEIYKKELSQVASQTKLKGFRKGKANNLIEQRDGPRIRAQSIEKLLDSEIKSLVNQLSHEVASTPVVEGSKGDGIKEELSMTVNYEIFPPIEGVELSKFKLDGVSSKVTAQDVADEISRIQDHLCEWKEVDSAAATGNRLKMDYAGKIDGELFEGGSATDQQITLGASQFLPEFEKALVGAKKGDQRQFDVKFPEDYHGKEVAGKVAQFEVNVQAVEEKKHRAMNKEFYQAAGVDVTTKAEFEKELKARLEKDLAYLVEAVNRRRLLKKLQSAIKVILPESVVEKEVKNSMEQEKGVNEKDAKAMVSANIERALIIKHYMREIAVKVTPDEIKEHIEIMAPPQVTAEQFFQWYVQDQNRVQQAHSTLLEQKTLSALLEKVDLKTQSKSVKDIEAELKESM